MEKSPARSCLFILDLEVPHLPPSPASSSPVVSASPHSPSLRGRIWQAPAWSAPRRPELNFYRRRSTGGVGQEGERERCGCATEKAFCSSAQANWLPVATHHGPLESFMGQPVPIQFYIYRIASRIVFRTKISAIPRAIRTTQITSYMSLELYLSALIAIASLFSKTLHWGSMVRLFRKKRPTTVLHFQATTASHLVNSRHNCRDGVDNNNLEKSDACFAAGLLEHMSSLAVCLSRAHNRFIYTVTIQIISKPAV
jgi:hypothetical protein